MSSSPQNRFSKVIFLRITIFLTLRANCFPKEGSTFSSFQQHTALPVPTTSASHSFKGFFNLIGDNYYVFEDLNYIYSFRLLVRLILFTI